MEERRGKEQKRSAHKKKDGREYTVEYNRVKGDEKKSSPFCREKIIAVSSSMIHIQCLILLLFFFSINLNNCKFNPLQNCT